MHQRQLYLLQFFLFCFCNNLFYMVHFISSLLKSETPFVCHICVLVCFVLFFFRNKVCFVLHVPILILASSSTWKKDVFFIFSSLDSDSLFKCIIIYSTLHEAIELQKAVQLMAIEWMCAKFTWDFKVFIAVVVVIAFPKSWKLKNEKKNKHRGSTAGILTSSIKCQLHSGYMWHEYKCSKDWKL